MSKSTWGSVYVGDASSQRIAASYFGGMADDYEILDAECLEHNETGRTLKIRAIGRDEKGAFREFIRTCGRNFSVTSRPVAPRRLRERGVQS
jgi:hypothetical protein